MANTGLHNFDTTVQETNELLVKIEEEFEWPKERREQSYSALRSVLHAVRDQLPVNEAVEFAEQLPMLVKGIYYEGWQPENVPERFKKEEFEQKIREEFPYSLEEDFDDFIKKVFNLIADNVANGEIDQVKGNLPREIQQMLS